MPIGLSVAILTYGKRKRLLFSVVDALLNQDYKFIYIYCNGLDYDCFAEIKRKYNNRGVFLFYSPDNLGSAGGYNNLIEYASSHNNVNHLLLLDDDNLVPSDFFEKVTPQLSETENEILFINRKDREILRLARDSSKPCLELGTKNSFLGRDIFSKKYPDYEKTESDLIAAPYSGLILPPSILKKRILPNKDYFLYADDHEYTYRLVTEHGYKIKMIDDVSITDLEHSFHLEKKSTFLANRYLEAPKIRLFFSVRNQLYFGLSRSNRRLLFYTNVILVSCFILLGFLVRLDIKRVFWFLSALKAGFRMEKEHK
ncbi:glycosyltransferase [Pseudoalteromonas sp. SSDWG2]|uniref:glycosyltransferase n=1 Tax=Pseudoalteromonas sp. SSDWG2 TaxID=3139391 RepID=UPI003BADB39E